MAPGTDPQLSSQDTTFFSLVFQRIEKNPAGSIPFSEYMELALYHPEFGYYARPWERSVGRSGDFFTSVSVGALFGELLARRIAGEWRDRLGGAIPLAIVEQGAHDGQLACDIARALGNLGDSVPAWDYRVVEPRESVRERLRERFLGEGLGNRVRVVPSLAEAAAESGVFLCNELLDAFPVDRLVLEGGEWRELRVGRSGDRPGWVSHPLREGLAPFAGELGTGFPEGYETEVCPAVESWTAEAAGLFERGLWWIIDYGFESDDYFSPARRTGTLRCYRAHRADEDPFSAPGETDITAHVNFTHLRRAAESAGMAWEGLTDQHHFLTEAARPWLLSLEGKPPEGEEATRLRQFRTLTHPGLMGRQFHVATFSRGS